MEHYLQSNFIQNSLGDLCSIHLTVIGICFTIITLLYSFIFSKRSELDSLSDALKNKVVEPLVAQKHGQIIRYIKNLSGIISKCYVALLMSCGIWIICWIDKMFLFTNIIRRSVLLGSILLTIIEIIVCIYWCRLIYFQYKRDIDV